MSEQHAPVGAHGDGLQAIPTPWKVWPLEPHDVDGTLVHTPVVFEQHAPGWAQPLGWHVPPRVKRVPLPVQLPDGPNVHEPSWAQHVPGHGLGVHVVPSPW
jgi:hypothetical protein